MTEVAGTIEQIVRIVGDIAVAVERQSDAARTIAHNVDTASDGTQRVSGDIAGVAQVADETGRTADEVLRSAHELTKKATNLRGTVDTFLNRLRSA
jgi:methyl-accepting chemotaxis protein